MVERSEPNAWPTGAAQARRALIVVLLGLPGAGKSSVASAIVRELGLRRVSRDALREAMFPRCGYSFVEKRAAARALLLALEINCVLGESSVVDGMTFARRRDRERVVELAALHGFDVLPLLIDCAPALARARYVRDELARSADPQRGEGFVESIVTQFDEVPLSTVRVDGSLPLEAMCALAVAEVGARLGRGGPGDA